VARCLSRVFEVTSTLLLDMPQVRAYVALHDRYRISARAVSAVVGAFF
jgi:hypothetical protein